MLTEIKRSAQGHTVNMYIVEKSQFKPFIIISEQTF